MKKISVLLGFLALLASNTAFASFDKNLNYGARGTSVKELQEFLTDQGVFTGPVTGNFYSLTLKAVKAFQSKESIKPSGYWNLATRTSANNILAADLADSDNEQATEPTSTPDVKTPTLVTITNPAPAPQIIYAPTAPAGPIIDTNKAASVQNAINSSVSGLNNQISALNATVIPYVRVIYPLEVSPYQTPYQVGPYTDGAPITLLMATKDLGFPINFTDSQRTFVYDLQKKVRALNESIVRLNTISTEVQDYSSTGVIPPAEERSYLQSLGIVW